MDASVKRDMILLDLFELLSKKDSYIACLSRQLESFSFSLLKERSRNGTLKKHYASVIKSKNIEQICEKCNQYDKMHDTSGIADSILQDGVSEKESATNDRISVRRNLRRTKKKNDNSQLLNAFRNEWHLT